MKSCKNVIVLSVSAVSFLAASGCTELEMLTTAMAGAVILSGEPEEQRVEQIPSSQSSDYGISSSGNDYGLNNSSSSHRRQSQFGDLKQIAVGIGDMGGAWVSRDGDTRYYLLESVGQGKVITVNAVAGTYFATVIPIAWSYNSSQSQFKYQILSGSYAVGVETEYNASPRMLPPEKITWLDGPKKTFRIQNRVYKKLSASDWARQHSEIMNNLSIAADKNNFYDSNDPAIENEALWD